ncbi:MAG TPA: ATP-binding protein, partial [Dehalococcoidia bacterium]|nr:ATP-binding protein [Dehalococcoidia bacterium]
RNVERHSRATSATVTLAVAKDSFVARVADDGLGFDAAAVLGARSDGIGLGLVGMQERAKLIGGTLRITSQHGKGTRVALELATAAQMGPGEQ